MARKGLFITFLAATVWLVNLSVAVTTEQIKQVREFVHQTAAPAERQVHLKATLLALRSFAKFLNLPDPNLPDPLFKKPSEDSGQSIWALYQNTLRFCAAYEIEPEERLSVDPNKLTDPQRQALFNETAKMLELTEAKLVDQHIANLTLPLRVELGKELDQPTLTYVSLDGIQRSAITEKAVRLYDEIKAIENTQGRLLLSINDHYYAAHITVLETEKECSREQAKRVVDAWFDRKLTAMERAKAAELRRGKGLQRLQLQQRQLQRQQQQEQQQGQQQLQQRQQQHLQQGQQQGQRSTRSPVPNRQTSP